MDTNLNQFSWYNNISELECLIRYHQRLYYDLNEPEISDADFDAMWERLNELAPSSPVLQERSQFDADYQHAFPMGSLEKCKTPEEIVRRLGGKSKSDKGIITAKLDGASMTLHYDNGRLVRAVTRGRTETGKGKIVTANAMEITGVKQFVGDVCQDKFEVRGECVILLHDWATLADKYKNPRNAASGGISCQDPRETRARKITFVACKIIGWNLVPTNACQTTDFKEVPFDQQPLEVLERMGFLTPRHVEVDLSSVESVKAAIESWLEDRASLPYWNDGIVIRIADNIVYNDLGVTGVCPNGACAYKFENERAKTVLRRIEIETGRLGFVTPVAVFDPVELGGATVERCSLHNWEWMKVHGNPSVGAEITIEKCGDIIPGLASVEKPGNGDTFEPSVCPSCGSNLAKVDTNDGEGRKLKCPGGSKCPAQFRDGVLHMLRRLEIKGTAETTLDSIINANLFSQPWELLDLKQEALVGVGFGVVESQNIVTSFADLEATPENILAAVGVDGWGRRMFRILGSNPAFTEERMLSGDFPYSELTKVKGIGPSKARALSEAFAEGGYGLKFLVELLKRVKVTRKSVKPVVGGKLDGKSFCLSGTMPRGKKQIEQDVVANGGIIRDGVSKDLSFLVAGDGSGSKSAKATKYGVKIISEDELYKMM